MMHGRRAVPSGRKTELDGMRGILSSLVLVHHYVIYSASLQDSSWHSPSSNVLNQLGSGSVALFFMLSAYLLGDKVIRLDRPFIVSTFLRHRVRRIVPVYSVAVGISIAIAFALRPGIHDSAGAILFGLFRWYSFGFLTPRDINGVPLSSALMSVSWSLYYEWLLYLLLIPIAVICRDVGRRWPAYLILALAAVWDHHFSLFLFGLIALRMPAARSRGWAIAAAIATPVVFVGFHESTSWQQGALLFPLFMVVSHGMPVAHFLNSRPLQYLGAISYDIYLLQIPMLFVIGKLGLDDVIREQTPISTLFCLAVSFLVTVIVSAIVHRLVERQHRADMTIPAQRVAYCGS